MGVLLESRPYLYPKVPGQDELTVVCHCLPSDEEDVRSKPPVSPAGIEHKTLYYKAASVTARLL